jgi:NTP pyrophosphatase (non-canonical NTP hydrolase)
MFNLYVKLMEECGEVVRACSKVLKRGRSGVENQQLAEEIGDVLAILDLLRRKGAIDMRKVELKRQETYEKYIYLELE